VCIFSVLKIGSYSLPPPIVCLNLCLYRVYRVFENVDICGEIISSPEISSLENNDAIFTKGNFLS